MTRRLATLSLLLSLPFCTGAATTTPGLSLDFHITGTANTSER